MITVLKVLFIRDVCVENFNSKNENDEKNPEVIIKMLLGNK